MSDDMIEVSLVGGPCDGGTLPVPREAVHGDPEPGYDFVPPDEASAPVGRHRVLYLAREGEDPAVWHWQGWVP